MAKKLPPAWVPARARQRGAEPALVADVLVGAEEFVRRQTGVAMSRDEWRAIVGGRIASRTRVARLSKGVLSIQVASSAWSSELSFLKPELLRKLQSAGHDIFDLRFVVDKFEAPPRPHHPFLKRPPTPTALPPDLEARLNNIEDPNLRAAIREAAELSLSPRKEKH